MFGLVGSIASERGPATLSRVHTPGEGAGVGGPDVAVGDGVGQVPGVGVGEAAGVGVGTGAPPSAFAAWANWMRGVSWQRVVTRVSRIGLPVVRSAFSTWSIVAPGVRDLSSAQAPATCGAAIEVPLLASKPPPSTDETIASPGA